MPGYLEGLLTNVFEAQGSSREKASDLARLAVLELERVRMIDPASIAQAERDAKIYDLRAVMTVPALSVRFGLTTRQVIRIVKGQMLIRRAS